MKLSDPWIAVDWGTTRLRAWLMDGAAQRDLAQSELGMAGLKRDAFAPALKALVNDWVSTSGAKQVVACGMVGSRQGWVEAPYRSVPSDPSAGAPVSVADSGIGLEVWVLPGLRQDNPADVMRGEETQIAGYLGLNPEFDGVLCLPGTHTKWAQISAGEVVSFRTYMTGELFSALQTHTVLKHSLTAPGWDEDAFDSAVTQALAHPQRLAADLFGLRAENLLNGTSAAATRARLSGLLIGAELAGARPYWLGTEVAIIGADDLARAYARALQLQGQTVTLADVGQMTRAGLTRARALLPETTS